MYVLLFALAGCEGVGLSGGGDELEIELEDETIELDAGTELHEVRLGTEQGQGVIEPDTVLAHPGDVIRFVVADESTHAVVFDRGALPAPARAYLEESDQLRGPPLIAEGKRWIVRLESAPTGTYPFRCLAHHTRGVLRIAAEGDRGEK